MSAETKKVLELLAAGKISAEDAERLLDKLSSGTAQADAANSQAASGTSPDPGGSLPRTHRPRFLHIKVQRPDGRDTDVRVPLAAVRSSRHWTAFLPMRVAERLSEYGIDFGSLDALSELELEAAIDRINVQIQSHSGKNVRIYAE